MIGTAVRDDVKAIIFDLRVEIAREAIMRRLGGLTTVRADEGRGFHGEPGGRTCFGVELYHLFASAAAA